MDVSFGARLRAQRERQEVALSAISEQTKIRQSLLEELEHDNVSHWPSGIFRRSYLRAYAQAIGLDPEVAVREFLDLYPDPIEEPAAGRLTIQSGSVTDPQSQRPNSRLHYMIGSAINAIPQLLFRPDVKESAPAAAPREIGMPKAVDSYDDVSPPVIHKVATLRQQQSDRPAAVQPAPVPALDLAGMAQLCTRFAQVRVATEIAPLLSDAARILRASGIILWVWDPSKEVLWPSISHGYPADVLAQLPSVQPDFDNAIAGAFRAGEACVVASGDASTGAVVVPMLTPTGCAGVVALEFRDGRERDANVHALTTIFAAQLSTLVEVPQPAVARSATA
jgi:transcriptional regulator with XRE-family HTH domain